jgi:transposase
MANEFWLTDDEWAAIKPLIPMHRRGVKPRNSRRIISGIVHVLKTGCRWRDRPAVFGPQTSVYNRFNRWSRAGIWQEMFERLVQLIMGMSSRSTAPPARPTGAVQAEKGG